MADKTDRKYTAEHEWLDIAGTTATIGITDYAADKLGDVVFVELPKAGASVKAGKVVGVCVGLVDPGHWHDVLLQSLEAMLHDGLAQLLDSWRFDQALVAA